MRKSILVPLDGTVFAEQAIPVALAVAHRTGAELHPALVHLADHFQDVGLGLGAPVTGMDGELMVREADYLESISERLSDQAVRIHPPIVLRGDVPDALAAHVKEHGIDGVVMTTHGRGSFERFLVPSVADALFHRLTVPMVLLRPAMEEPPEGRFHATPALQTVLVALDGSPDAEVALERALETCGEDARYVLVRVIESPRRLSSVYLPHAVTLQRQEEDRRRHEARGYLDEVEERVRERAPKLERQIVVHHRPGEAIVQVAATEGADLIAVGSHGHRPLRDALFGSVTHDVLQRSQVPVLVARRGD